MLVFKHSSLRIKNCLILHFIGPDGTSKGWGESEGSAWHIFTRALYEALLTADFILDTTRGVVEPGLRLAVLSSGGLVPALSEQDGARW